MAAAGTIFAAPDVIAAEVAAGRIVVLWDEGRCGYLLAAARSCRPETVNFMAREGGGLVSLALSSARCDQLGLDLIPGRNIAPHSKSFTVSIEAKEGVSTGISARDRARTVAAAIAPDAGPGSLVSPGHVFPLRADERGVLARAGVAEAAVDLARLEGIEPAAAVVCEILGREGDVAGIAEIRELARRHELEVGTIASLRAYRQEREGTGGRPARSPRR